MYSIKQPVNAQSYSTALDTALPTDALAIHLLSMHTHAYNFVTATSVVIALVTPHHGNGPFQIVVPAPLPRLPKNTLGVSGEWRQDRLTYGDLQINLEQAEQWHPRLPALPAAPSSALATLVAVASQFPASALTRGTFSLTQRAQQGIDYLQIGLAAHDRNKLRTGVIHLAGLGPGLTPAGDDFLVGLLAALQSASWSQMQQAGVLPGICAAMAETAAERTMRLSAAWLRAAGQGCFGEPWHHLIVALNANSTDAITAAAHRILTTGATSGVDAMTGFLWGIHVLSNEP